MRYEIDKHWEKLKQISGLREDQLSESKYWVFKKIHFIREDLIPPETWLKAESIVKNIDEDDIDFIAINEFLNANLWTGDKRLYNGLKKKGYKHVLNTNELYELRLKNK